MWKAQMDLKPLPPHAGNRRKDLWSFSWEDVLEVCAQAGLPLRKLQSAGAPSIQALLPLVMAALGSGQDGDGVKPKHGTQGILMTCCQVWVWCGRKTVGNYRAFTVPVLVSTAERWSSFTCSLGCYLPPLGFKKKKRGDSSNEKGMLQTRIASHAKQQRAQSVQLRWFL